MVGSVASGRQLYLGSYSLYQLRRVRGPLFALVSMSENGHNSATYLLGI